MRATIFVTPEFVDPRPIVRQRVEPGSMLDEAHEAGGCCAGFLSWLELREMERSGLVDVQCHGLTHTWHFKGPRVVDFWRPGAATERMGPIWLLWNTFPDAKPYYLTQAAERESDIPYGAPIYEHGKALETRRFFPDPGLEEELTAYVRQHGGVRFFDDPDWRGRLTAIVSRASAPGRFETDEDHVRRIRQELSESRAVLSQQLGKTIDAFCWPGGGVNDTVLEIAREIGYRHFTLPSAWREAYARGQYRDLVPRIGSRDRVRWRSRDLGRPTPREFVWHIESARNSRRHKLLHRCAISVRLGWSYLKRSID
jgi:peptidoglycan/xylan/chitin deacetylase (PgdA/CDA1 family)